MRQHQVGVAGEEMAQRYLTERYGMRCLARRYRAQDGEIDLIMEDGDAVVFVEVKARPGGRAGSGFAAVGRDKQRRLAHAALNYLIERDWMAPPVRFDVVEITRDGIMHIPNAWMAC